MKNLTQLVLVIALIHITTPWCLKTTVNLTNEVTKVDFSPDGLWIAVTSTSANEVYIYDTTNYFLNYTYTPNPGTVTVARWNKNGSHFAIGHANGKIDFLNGAPPFAPAGITITPSGGGSNIIDLDFNWDHNMLLLCYSDNDNFRILNDYVGTHSDRLHNSGDKQISCRFGANNVAVVATIKQEIRTYDITLTTISNFVSKVKGDMDWTDVAVKPATTPAKIVASGGNNAQDGGSYFTNSGTNTQVVQSNLTFLNTPSVKVNTACYAGDGAYYALGGEDKKMWIYKDTTNTEYQVMFDGINSFTNCMFSYDGNTMIAGTKVAGTDAYVFVYVKVCSFCQPGSYKTSLATCVSCSSAITSCSMCSSATICTACFQGYYLDSTAGVTTCISCFTPLNGCSTCASNTTCIECNHGWYLNSVTCSTCNSLKVGCLACNSTNCFQCSREYYLSAPDCVLCSSTINNCLRCTANNLCIHCMEGYFVPVAGAATCFACDTKCLICYATSTNCTLCTRGYYLSGNTCTPCSTNCLECTSTTCLDCATGYFPSGANCVACTQPCVTCVTSTTNCLSCTVGFYLNGNACTACINNCSICSSSTNCSACNIGYYHTASDTCLACTGQYTGCTQCSLGACLACDQTRYLASATACTVCNTSMAGCQFCSSSSNCTLCAVGYYKTGTSCALCSTHCEICTSNALCQSCVVGYWLSGTTCAACTPPCLSCSTSATTCLSCVTGYYFNAVTCTACTGLTNCLTCLNSTYCTSCVQGFYPSTGTCTTCPTNCLNCNSTNCHACTVGFYVSAPLVCSPCAQNCSICSASNNCTGCNVGYYLDTALATNQCVICSTMGSACLTCNKTDCYSCSAGYYLSGIACQACSSGVSFCSLCTASNVCNLCQDGYYLASATSCLSCSSLLGCIACQDASTCLQCASGYYLLLGACSPCAGNCSACSSPTVCSVCATSFYLSSTSCPSCQDILQGCQYCTNSTVCLGCEGGYRLVSTLCQPCSKSVPACSICNVTGDCVSCQQGYFLNGTNDCQLCSSSASLVGCLICNTSSNCQYCDSGYYLSGITCSLCSTTLPGCDQCLNIGTCLDCSSGYYLNTVTNGCQLCQVSLPGCIFCSSNTVCIQCQSGFYLSGIDCLACTDPGCQICNTTTPTNCITCNTGYYLNGNSCTACPQIGCSSCNSTVCLICQSGYYLSGGSCILCSSTMNGCSKCTGSSTCIECQSLFYLSSNTCTICNLAMVGCSFCINSTTCLSCDGGYYLNAGTNQCDPCSNILGCLICNGSTSCLTCNSGYYLSGNLCVSCDPAIPNCFQCFNNSVCVSCQSGYTVAVNGSCEAMQVSGGASKTPEELTFKSYYYNKTVIKHALSVKDHSSKFSNTNQVDWPSVTKIYVESSNGSIFLNLLWTELSSDSYTFYFYTDNPQVIQTRELPIADKGRILAGQSMTELNIQTSIQLPKTTISTVLPSVLIANDLSMSYALDASEFYVSYVQEEFHLIYWIFGAIICVLVLVYGFMRATCLVLYFRNIEIFGHTLALKTMSLVVYPTYAEYVNFCLGFMAVDLPWLNAYAPDMFRNVMDIAPTGYYFYFKNMNFSSMHLFTLGIFLLMLILAYCLLSDPKTEEVSLQNKKIVNYKFKAFKEFLFNYFSFGLAFAGFSSVIGAFLNYSSTLSLNGIFYIIGVIVFGIILSQAFACLILNKRIGRLRIVLKATLLAGAGLNPLYLAATAMIVDGLLIAMEYKLRKDSLTCPKSWLVSNILILSALVCLYFIPDSFLALGIVIALVVIAYIFEIYQFCCEKGLSQSQKNKLFQEEHSVTAKDHFWNLQDKHDSQIDLSEKDKSHEKESPKRGGDLVFDVQGENVANSSTMSTKYGINPFEPKRRTRKFKSNQPHQQPNSKTGDSWNMTIKQNDEFFLDQ